MYETIDVNNFFRDTAIGPHDIVGAGRVSEIMTIVSALSISKLATLHKGKRSRAEGPRPRAMIELGH